jgi:hypothetical protein
MTETEAVRVRPSPDELLRDIAHLTSAHPEPGPNVPRIALPDADLLEALHAAANIERRKLAMFTGPARIDDDDTRDAQLDILDEQQLPFLAAAIAAVPTTCTAHRARAIMLLLIDAGAIYANARLGDTPDRLRCSVLHDLATS